MLVPDEANQSRLWPSRVWPGAVLVDGEIVGTWRRSGPKVSVELWQPLNRQGRASIEAEVASLPLPEADRPISVHWED